MRTTDLEKIDDSHGYPMRLDPRWIINKTFDKSDTLSKVLDRLKLQYKKEEKELAEYYKNRPNMSWDRRHEILRNFNNSYKQACEMTEKYFIEDMTDRINANKVRMQRTTQEIKRRREKLIFTEEHPYL